MPEFHETRMGVRFFEAQVPKLIDLLERLSRSSDAGAQAMVKLTAILDDRSERVADALENPPPDDRIWIVKGLGGTTAYATPAVVKEALHGEFVDDEVSLGKINRWSGETCLRVGDWMIEPTLLRREP